MKDELNPKIKYRWKLNCFNPVNPVNPIYYIKYADPRFSITCL